MAVNPLKIRLGACDTMVLFGNTTNAVDLGGSVGGAELNYNPTTFQVEVDQLILPAAAFKTKEEVEFTAALVQSQMNLAAIAFGYGSSTSSNVTTTAAGTLAAPSAGTVTVIGFSGFAPSIVGLVGWARAAAAPTVQPMGLATVVVATVTAGRRAGGGPTRAGRTGTLLVGGSALPVAGAGWTQPRAVPTTQPVAMTVMAFSVVSGRRAGAGPSRAAGRVLAMAIPGGSTTYSYQWVAFNSNGDSLPSPTFSTTTGNTPLSTTNFNQVNPPTGGATTGAVGYKLIRTAGGTSQGLIGTFYGQTAPTVNDTGLAAVAYTPAGSAPAMPNQDQMPFGGQVFIPTGTFDFSVPKNDGSLLHLRGHLNKVYSAKAIKLNASRDKHTEMSKLSLIALADTTQALGKQAGYLIEEY